MLETKQQYLTIGKMAKLIDIQPHILRYWEKKIPQVSPKRINGRRFYTREQAQILSNLKVLIIDHHYTLEGARQKLFGRQEQDSEVKNALSIQQTLRRLVDDLSNLLEIVA